MVKGCLPCPECGRSRLVSVEEDEGIENLREEGKVIKKVMRIRIVACEPYHEGG